jgi:uncharacterized membrane protein YsdA (DUF1294 family)/cold shock CspA family protein
VRYQGRITTWKDDKGFGFITPNGGGPLAFVHISAFSNQARRPGGDELVTYEVTRDDKGRIQAKSVAFVGEKPAMPPTYPGRGWFSPILAICFLVFVAAMVSVARLPRIVLALYCAASVITYFAYVFDKSAAERGQWRVQENTLHLFALVGGWPGALFAQRRLRHKTAKTSFQYVCRFTVALNCAALAWLLSSNGARWLHSVLGY